MNPTTRPCAVSIPASPAETRRKRTIVRLKLSGNASKPIARARTTTPSIGSTKTADIPPIPSDRPALKEMLRDLREGKLNCVLAYKIDRLTRSVRDFHQLMDVFDRHGVKFVSVTQSLDTQNPMGRLLRNVLLDFAQFEREMTADRTRDKMHQRAQKGLWNGGNVPYGYKAENKRLIANGEETTRLQFMFERFAETPSLARLRDDLHRRGWYNRSKQPWSKTALDQILRNPIYSGYIRFNEQLYKGDHAAHCRRELVQEGPICQARSQPQYDYTQARFLTEGFDSLF